MLWSNYGTVDRDIFRREGTTPSMSRIRLLVSGIERTDANAEEIDKSAFLFQRQILTIEQQGVSFAT